MAKKTFWENLGRSIGQGWRKAKDATAHFAEKAEGTLDLRHVRKQLQRHHEKLGRLVATRAEDPEAKLVRFEEPDVKDLLELIRRDHAEIAEIEAEIARRREEGGSGSEAGASSPGPPRPEDVDHSSENLP
jgi:hypothetical protein